MSQDRHFAGKSYWKQLGCACKFDGVESRELLVRARLMESQIWHLSAGSVGEGSSKEQ